LKFICWPSVYSKKRLLVDMSIEMELASTSLLSGKDLEQTKRAETAVEELAIHYIWAVQEWSQCMMKRGDQTVVIHFTVHCAVHFGQMPLLPSTL
jgi:hypothetical protein